MLKFGAGGPKPNARVSALYAVSGVIGLIRTEMSRRGLTVYDLAASTGVPVEEVNEWLSEKYDIPAYALLLLIEHGLKLSCRQFFTTNISLSGD